MYSGEVRDGSAYVAQPAPEGPTSQSLLLPAMRSSEPASLRGCAGAPLNTHELNPEQSPCTGKLKHWDVVGYTAGSHP